LEEKYEEKAVIENILSDNKPLHVVFFAGKTEEFFSISIENIYLKMK